jgi:hypothetical protein
MKSQHVSFSESTEDTGEVRSLPITLIQLEQVIEVRTGEEGRFTPLLT